MDAAARLANGIDNLPGSLEEAVQALESDELMAAALGEHVFPATSRASCASGMSTARRSRTGSSRGTW